MRNEMIMNCLMYKIFDVRIVFGTKSKWSCFLSFVREVEAKISCIWNSYGQTLQFPLK